MSKEGGDGDVEHLVEDDLNATKNEKVPTSGSRTRSKKSTAEKITNSMILSQDGDSTKNLSPSKAEIAEQVALPSNEDVPPPASKRKSTVKEDLIFEEVSNQKANRELRSTYAGKAYKLAFGCIQFWAVAISLNAIIYVLTGKLMISDNAMIAITTGVTVNVLAAFLGVIRGLFPSDSIKSKRKKKLGRRKKG